MSEIGPAAPSVPAPQQTGSGQSAPSPAAPAQPASGQPAQGQPAQGQSAQGQSAQGQTAAGQTASSGAPASSTPASPNAPAASPASQATQISEALRALANGASFTAQVVARDGAALLVRTASGTTLALNNLAAALEQANVAVLNAALRLQLAPNNPQQATVLSANGTSLIPPLAAQAQPPSAAQLALAAAPPSAASAAAPALSSLPQPGQTLSATVLAPPPAAAAGLPLTSPGALPTAAALPPGSRVQLIVQNVTLPSTQAPPPAAPTTAAPMAAVPVATAPSAASPPLASNLQPPVVSITSTPALPPSAPSAVAPAATPPLPILTPGTTPPAASVSPAVSAAAATASPAATPTSITGIVTAQPPPPATAAQLAAASGRMTQAASSPAAPAPTVPVLVSTPQGLLALNLPQALPPGTQIAVELAAVIRPPAPAPAALGPSPLGGVLARLQGDWPALQQTLDALRSADPVLAQRLQDALPQPNARLAATALQFMAASAIGSAQAWLGAEAVRRLEQSGRSDLLRRLDDDFRELGRLNQRQGDTDWQALVLPMLIGGRVEPIQIFMRRRRDPRKKQQQTRFIIDFNLQSTGPIQFDGLVSASQLDLILRSESEFGPAFRLDVTAIFEEALAITGMSGSIRFHDREAPLDWPSPELEGQGPSTEIKV